MGAIMIVHAKAKEWPRYWGPGVRTESESSIKGTGQAKRVFRGLGPVIGPGARVPRGRR